MIHEVIATTVRDNSSRDGVGVEYMIRLLLAVMSLSQPSGAGGEGEDIGTNANLVTISTSQSY